MYCASQRERNARIQALPRRLQRWLEGIQPDEGRGGALDTMTAAPPISLTLSTMPPTRPRGHASHVTHRAWHRAWHRDQLESRRHATGCAATRPRFGDKRLTRQASCCGMRESCADAGRHFSSAYPSLVGPGTCRLRPQLGRYSPGQRASASET